MTDIPISTFIIVNVNLIGSVTETFAFGVPMIVGEHNITSNRQDGPYASVAEGEAAGFTEANAPQIHAEISSAFNQSPTVASVMVGRRIPAGGGLAASVLQVVAIGPVFVDMTSEYNSATDADWIVFPVAEAAGDYAAIGMPEPFTQVSLDNLNGTAGVGGTVDWEYWNGTAWTALAGIVDGTTGFTAGVADGQVVSWTVPVDWIAMSLNGEAPQYYVRAVITGVYATDPEYDQGHTGEDANLAASLSAVLAWDPTTWYMTLIDTRTDADVSSLASWTQSNGGGDFPKTWLAQTSSTALLNGTAANIGEVLRLANYNRGALIYHAVDTEALAMAWAGRCLSFDLDGVKTVGDWAYKELVGPAGANISPAQVNNLEAENVSFYGPARGKTFTFNGEMPKGAPQFLDTITTADWAKVRLQEAFLNARVGALTTIGYDDPGLQFLGGKFENVGDLAVTAGHSLGGDKAPVVTVPLLKNVSSTDQANRVARYSMTFNKRNSILTVVFVVNMNLTGG